MAHPDIHGRLVWYELLTTDPKAAEKFYKTVVGWDTKPFDESPQPYTMWVPPGGRPIGGMMAIPPGMNFPPHWEMYIGVPKLDETVARIERLGGSALSPVIDVPNVGRMRTMKDPQGAVFAMIEPASDELLPEAAPEMGEASWHELYTSDALAAQKFYFDVFGWKSTSDFDMGAMGKYHMFGGRTKELGGMMTMPKEMGNVPPNWNIYFRIPDANAGAERVKANGGKILNGPMDVPGGDRVVVCMDPQGAAFSLHQKK
jgi:predicted enzyme related to lactoylglutathione lyase